jgi:putative tryptophan/tyrosine transport system substrate-binding protein
MMRRREFIAGLGGAVAWPLAARAQQRKSPVVVYLTGGSPGGVNDSLIAAVRKGLGESGYIDGQNLTLEFSFADRQYDRLPALATELARRQVDVIFGAGIPAARAAKGATSTIPIVFALGEDPVKEDLVASLNRPGGNITGFSHFTNQLIGKRLELLKQVAPSATVIAFLVDANNPVAEPDARDAQRAATTLGLRLEVLRAGSEREINSAFAAMAERHVGALALSPAPFFFDQREQIIALAARHAFPSIYDQRLFPMSGGLMSYGANQEESWRQGGIYVGRILKGEKPGDLPVQQSTKIEFVINLKTAKMLGLTVPLPLLGFADQVIE